MDIVKKDSIFVYGGSRGAVIAAMVATKDSRIAGFILRSGLYDFVDAYEKYPWYSSIKLAMIWEIGWNRPDALKERSALYFADQRSAYVRCDVVTTPTVASSSTLKRKSVVPGGSTV